MKAHPAEPYGTMPGLGLTPVLHSKRVRSSFSAAIERDGEDGQADDEFEALVEAAVAERDGARSGDAEAEEADGGGRPAAGVFLSNAGWSSRGSHLGEG